MDMFFENARRLLKPLPEFSVLNIIEIFIITFLIYKILILLKNSHAFSVLRGIFVIFLFTVFAWVLHLDSILWIMEKVSGVAVLALVVIFQPELRKGLESLGNQAVVPKIMSFDTGSMTAETAREIARASFEMSKVKTGALIVIEQSEDLSSYVDTGIRIDGIASAALLINIFEKNTPLHDGAVIIRGNKVVSATCYLPLSDDDTISKDLGTRHRAAIGMSAVTDSVVIVVSEETGHVSLARDGVLTRVISQDHMNIFLGDLMNGNGKKKNTEEVENG